MITQDAIIGGKVTGSVSADSRLELQATCQIQGEIRARRIKLDEGGQINGNVRTGDVEWQTAAPRPAPDASRAPTAEVTVGAPNRG